MMGYTKTKRLLNLLTAAAVAVTSLSAPFAVSAADNAEVGSGAEETQATVSAEDRKAVELGFCDFDGKNNCIGGGSSVKIDDEHKNSIAVPNAGAIGLTFPKKINSGKVIISYDVYFDNLAGHVFRTYSDENATGSEFENIVVQNNGNMYIAKGNAWIVNNVPFRAYETKKWHSVELTYDFDARKYKLALDGEFIGQEDMKSTLTEIQSFRLLPISDGIKVDNMGAVYIPTDGIIDMSQYPYIEYYEEELDNGIQPWIQTGQLGDAYFGKDMDFKLKLVNNNSKASKGKIKMTYMNADGVSEISEADYQIDGYGVETLDLSMTTECYGMGELKAEVIEDGGVLVGTSSKDVAVSAPGRLNPKVGLNDHISRPSMGYDQFEMLVKAGCGVYRDGPDTTALVKSSGQVGNTEPAMDRFFELAEQNQDIRYTLTLHIGGPYSGWDGTIPIGDKQIETWLIYVKEVLKMSKNLQNVDFEIGNEYNYPMQWNPEKYTSKLYYEACKAAYPVIKAERPDSNVYVFGAAANNETDRFLTECLEMGIADCADGFSIHPYDVFHSGEYPTSKEKVEHYHKIFEDAGHGDMPVIYTEYGWSVCGATGVDFQEKARWYPQSAMLYTDYAEYIEYYNLMNKNDAGEFESNFGLVENFMKEVPYKPTPALLTLSNYNRVMANTGNLDKRDYADGNSTVCLVDNEYGTKSVMAWMKEDKPDTKVALNVGTDKVVVGDMYGNEKEVVTENGILNITLRQDPMYITGDIHDVSEAETNIYVNESTLDLVEGDTGHITGKLPDSTYSVEVVCPDNIKADAAEIKSDGTFAVKLNVGKKGLEGEKIRVNIKKGEDIVYTGYTEINYTKLAEVSSTIVYYRDSYWQLKLKVKNRTNSLPLNGKIVLTEPETFEIPEAHAQIKNLTPGSQEYVRINISPKYTRKKLDIKGYVEFDNGETIEFSDVSYFVGLMHIKNQPVIDGKIDEYEYNTVAPVKINTTDCNVVKLENFPGIDETNAVIYLNYDDNNLYLAAKVYDSVEGATGDSTKVWQNDSIQLSFAETPDYSAPKTEYAIGKDNTGKPTITRYYFMGSKTVAAGGEADEVALGDEIKLEIGRDGMYTIYEFKIPWTEVFGEERPTLDRRDLLFSALINDNDGLGRTGYVEFCPGIGGAKDPSLFSKLQAMN